jgi:hypothetical protein
LVILLFELPVIESILLLYDISNCEIITGLLLALESVFDNVDNGGIFEISFLISDLLAC